MKKQRLFISTLSILLFVSAYVSCGGGQDRLQVRFQGSIPDGVTYFLFIVQKLVGAPLVPETDPDDRLLVTVFPYECTGCTNPTANPGDEDCGDTCIDLERAGCNQFNESHGDTFRLELATEDEDGILQPIPKGDSFRLTACGMENTSSDVPAGEAQDENIVNTAADDYVSNLSLQEPPSGLDPDCSDLIKLCGEL